MNDLKHLEIKQVAEFMTKLPLRLPNLEKSLTEEQLTTWKEEETCWDINAQCFYAFGLGQDNPLIDLQIGKFYKEFFWNKAEFYYRLWELTQIVGPSSNKDFRELVHLACETYKVKEDFFNDFEVIVSSNLVLFKRILYDIATNDIQFSLKNYHESSITKEAKAMKAAIEIVEKDTDTGSIKIQSNRIKANDPISKIRANYSNHVMDDPHYWLWWNIVLKISQHRAETDEQVKKKWVAFECVAVEVGKLRLTAYRKGNSDTFNKLRSFSWNKGGKYFAAKGGAYTIPQS